MVHYRVQNSPLLVPFLSQINTVHNFPTYIPKIHNSMGQSPSWELNSL